MPNMDGGCLCGDVRYSATGEPKVISTCHCTDCQKQSGSAFVEVVAVPNETFTLHARPKALPTRAIAGGRKPEASAPAAARC